MKLVIDASVAIKWFVPENNHEIALDLLDRRDRLAAPDLLLVETANIAWKKAIRGEIRADQAEMIAAILPRYIETLRSAQDLIATASRMALALRHPVYDCVYIACAEAAEATLITADSRLIRAVSGTLHERRITLLENAGQIVSRRGSDP
jgi:predicted nucleic acid-binding protein